MENLHIPISETSPLIKFDANTLILEIKGEARLENARAFFDTLLDWINELNKQYANQKNVPLKLMLHFDYLNSSSIKYLYDLLSAFDILIFNVTVFWHYYVQDELMKENGLDYQQMLPKLNFKLVESL